MSSERSDLRPILLCRVMKCFIGWMVRTTKKVLVLCVLQLRANRRSSESCGRTIGTWRLRWVQAVAVSLLRARSCLCLLEALNVGNTSDIIIHIAGSASASRAASHVPARCRPACSVEARARGTPDPDHPWCSRRREAWDSGLRAAACWDRGRWLGGRVVAVPALRDSSSTDDHAENDPRFTID